MQIRFLKCILTELSRFLCHCNYHSITWLLSCCLKKTPSTCDFCNMDIAVTMETAYYQAINQLYKETAIFSHDHQVGPRYRKQVLHGHLSTNVGTKELNPWTGCLLFVNWEHDSPMPKTIYLLWRGPGMASHPICRAIYNHMRPCSWKKEDGTGQEQILACKM